MSGTTPTDESVSRGACASEPPTEDEMTSKPSSEWVFRSRDWIAVEPELPGVWRRRDGGYRIRGRALDPRTGKLREVERALPDCTKAREAFAVLQAELERIRAGTP